MPLRAALFLIGAALLALPPGELRAQTGAAAPAPSFAVTLVNSGAAPVDLLWIDDNGAIQPLDITIAPGWQQVLEEVEPGTRLLVRDSGASADAEPFYQIAVGSEAPAQPIVIPDPRLQRPAELGIINPLESEVVLFLPSDTAPGEWTEFDRIAPRAEPAYYDIPPRTALKIEATDGSFTLFHEVGLEAEQTLDLGAVVDPADPVAEVTVDNRTAAAVLIEELRPAVRQRLGSVAAGAAGATEAVVGADLRILAEDGGELGRHHVTAEAGQSVLVEGAEADKAVPAPVGIDLAILPEAKRAAAAAFLQKVGDSFAQNPGVTAYVAYNGGDEPVWAAGMQGDSLTGAKQIAPGAVVNVIAGVGNFSIFWPGDIPPERLTRADVVTSIQVAKDMPKVIDVSPPKRVALSVDNRVCKPVALYRVDPFGDERPVAMLDPMGRSTEPVKLPTHAVLVARAGPASLLAGEKLWTARLGDAPAQAVAIEAYGTTGYDPMRASTAGGAERTVHIHNSTSRGVDLFEVDAEGRELKLDTPVAAGKTETYYVEQGTVLVFHRPNVPPAISEYARMRVGPEPNQQVDVGELRRSRGVVGSWIDMERPALAEPNDVGTTFVSFVDQGSAGQGGLRIAGSMNKGDAAIGGPARFEGCADDREAFGHWYPVDFTIECRASHTDRDGRPTSSWGRFAAQRTATGTLLLRRGYCDDQPGQVSSWYPLPQHYDDMDPSVEAYQTGFYQLTWAPPSFDSMGRGFDLLRTDPLDYDAPAPGTLSDSPLFDFVYEDRAGSAGQIAAKSIFGVRSQGMQSRSDRCDRDEKLVRTLSDLEAFASKSYGASIGVPEIASFSLSKSHSEINTRATGSERVFIMERCDARLHTLKMDLRWDDRRGEDNLRQPLEIGFRNAVRQLPLVWGDGKALLAFFDRFGTHFSERITYGGTFFAETEVSKTTYQMADKEGDKLSLAAEGTIKKVSLGGTYEEEKSNGRSNDNEHANSTYRKWSVGGTGSEIYPVWVPTVAASPAPIDIGFRPIYDILTPVFFPDDPDIGLKNALLRRATAEYFRAYGKGDLTSDPKALDIRDPRHVCVKMEVVEYSATSGRDGDKFVSELNAGFVDSDNHVVSSAGPINLTYSPANLNDYRPVDPHLQPEQCTPAVTDGYVYSGSIYLQGWVGQYPDGWGTTSGETTLSANFPQRDQTFSLRRLESGSPQVFEGAISLPEGRMRYRLRVRVLDGA